jgi:DNA (cytosine-5)-methyltransferase 1
MKVLSLFSGVGGFDMGLENAGMETVFQCEWDKHANSILHKHWPDVPKWDDVSTLTGKHILAHAPVIDVVAWGSPCQDLSVAGKRAGLEGGRSGLFHEGIRIIKELQEESNGQYPRISIWENVVGALNSNKGADFGIILDEMAEAGALAIEWSVLDAQYFGIPQRRRRVFVIAIFDPVLANRSPNPLLPVSESLPGHLAKSKSKRKSAATKTSESIGTDGQWWDGRDTAEALTTTSNEQRMPDKQRFQAIVEQEVVGTLTVSDLVKGVNNEIIGKGLLQVVEDRQPFTSSSFAGYEEGVGTLRSTGGDLGGGSETLIAEPFVKSSRAQTSDDSETWIPGKVNPTLNSFDVGDTRATTAIVEPAIVFNDDRRIGPTIHGDTVSTLQAFMGTGGNNTPMVAQETEPPMLLDIQRVGDIRVYTEPVQSLQARMGTGGNSTPMLAFGIQGNVVGRQDHNGPAGKGHTEEGDPMFTLTSTDVHAVAYPIDTRNALRDPEKYDAQNRQGLGIGADGDPMATLTSAHVNAVAYDEYNDTTNDIHHALRAGTKQSTGVLLGSEVAATLRSGGDGGVPSSRGEHLVTETVMPALLAGLSHLTGTTQDGYVAKIHEVQSTMAVRRLTPLECERLMGWPDDHTRYKADGTEQADTHRYKQCGNGVASPVAQWIAKHILNI